MGKIFYTRAKNVYTYKIKDENSVPLFMIIKFPFMPDNCIPNAISREYFSQLFHRLLFCLFLAKAKAVKNYLINEILNKEQQCTYRKTTIFRDKLKFCKCEVCFIHSTFSIPFGSSVKWMFTPAAVEIAVAEKVHDMNVDWRFSFWGKQ